MCHFVAIMAWKVILRVEYLMKKYGCLPFSVLPKAKISVQESLHLLGLVSRKRSKTRAEHVFQGNLRWRHKDQDKCCFLIGRSCRRSRPPGPWQSLLRIAPSRRIGSCWMGLRGTHKCGGDYYGNACLRMSLHFSLSLLFCAYECECGVDVDVVWIQEWACTWAFLCTILSDQTYVIITNNPLTPAGKSIKYKWAWHTRAIWHSILVTPRRPRTTLRLGRSCLNLRQRASK